jgi:ABC-type phosphate transport system auxiliary subunit
MPKSTQEAKESLALLEAACNLVDALEMGHVKLTNTTLAKLRTTRSTVDKELQEEATKWQKEEEEEAKQEARKKAEQEKLNKLSPAEQEKVSHCLILHS